jgi:hypothetical protein
MSLMEVADQARALLLETVMEEPKGRDLESERETWRMCGYREDMLHYY